MTNKQNPKFQELVAKLREIFQIDRPELDFGIYRIMNAKRSEIEKFLDDELLPQVKSEFAKYRGTEIEEKKKELSQLEATLRDSGMNPDDSPKVKGIREELAKYGDDEALTNEVFSHLTSFFRRYYDGGDFLSLRRYKKDTYAIPYEYYENDKVRRYGFHGTSHKYVAHKAAEYLEEPIERLKLITCHLGNGSSIAAVDQGKVVDTSMGMTPLAGLMMGTRCGDLDPSVVNYLKYTLNITGHELDEILNKKSGLLGVSGVSSDKRDVEAAAAAGNPRAQLASDMLNYQIKKTIGSYIAAMGGVDAIVFTGGIGEHDADSRAKICHHMDWLGIRIDTDKNRDAHKQKEDVVEVTAWGARVRTLIIETNEELMIARDVMRA